MVLREHALRVEAVLHHKLDLIDLAATGRVFLAHSLFSAREVAHGDL